MLVELPIKYNQMDSRWGDIILGFNPGLPWNIYNFGCLLACLAMVAKYYGKDVNPLTLNELFIKMGAGKAFKAGSGEYVPGGFHLLYGDIEEVRTVTPALLTDAQIGEIKSAIDAGYPVVVQLDYNPKTVENDMHFVVLVDYNPNDENDFTIADPLTGNTRSLKDYLGWFKPNARNTIEQYIILKGKIPTNTSATIPVLKTDFVNLVHGSTEYDKIVNEYIPGADPKVTPFEDIQRVVAGYKSRATDLEKQKNAAETALAVAEQEIKNKEQEIADKQEECQTALKLEKARYDSLKASMPDVSKLDAQYRGTITDLQAKLKESNGKIATLQKQIVQLQSGQKPTNVPQWVIDFFNRINKQ